MNRKWKFDLSTVPNRNNRATSLPAPIAMEGIVEGEVIETVEVSADKEKAAKQKQAMAVAFAPGKNLLSTAFMLWMSGSSIQIFSIMMTGMALINPIKALAQLNGTFSRFEGDGGVDTKIPKLIFIGMQVLSLAVALYKCSSMGLLPTTSADWLSNIPVNIFPESSVVYL